MIITVPPLRPATARRPDEENHPTLDDDILNEGRPDPENSGRTWPEEDFPGFDDEQEPVPEQDVARA
ncbi:MAG TPA: hypothetical protein VHM91_23055 [Verrucomicrobiales bacterium]|jgi:hypothetical protein|nr:hypothetical protein [Verrucomicrobiales bacterium]